MDKMLGNFPQHVPQSAVQYVMNEVYALAIGKRNTKRNFVLALSHFNFCSICSRKIASIIKFIENHSHMIGNKLCCTITFRGSDAIED